MVHQKINKIPKINPKTRNFFAKKKKKKKKKFFLNFLKNILKRFLKNHD